MHIGIAGTGKMGAAMAVRLQSLGHQVTVWNRTRAFPPTHPNPSARFSATLESPPDLRPEVPVVMITKNEDEGLMEDAIGVKISDYLTKPVNPSQVLLACKKFLERKKITGAQVSRDYIKEFNEILDLMAYLLSRGDREHAMYK